MKKSDIEQIQLENVSLQNGLHDAQKDRDAWQSEYRAARAEVERVKTVRDALNRKERDLNAAIENQKEIMKEMGTRYRNKLMSVYYLLNTIKKMGTHREKEVAVNYLLQTVDDLIKGEDHLSWDQDLFRNLPF
jgi:chromosome segregation ATPase